MIEMSGRMDNVQAIGDKGKKFGLRISTKNKKTDEWESAWINVVVWEDCDGYSLVQPTNKEDENPKLTIDDAYPRAREWKDNDGRVHHDIEWTCSKLHLGWGKPDDEPVAATPLSEMEDSVPF